MKKLLVFFAAGCLGAFVNSLVVWQFGQIGISQALGVGIAPSLSPAWLYPRIVWGGLWGLLFILPMHNSRFVLKGLIISLFPALVQLLVIFPFRTHQGFGGIELGLLTPVLVLFFYGIWGVATALVIKFSR